jgi:methylphosphotriester-DNA--protein-cysteine methyltransferase
MNSKRYLLLNARGVEFSTRQPGQFGGHRRSKIYGKLDCPSALNWIVKGHYVAHRVFFRDARTARLAGYRPCANCLPDDYAAWKKTRA